MRSQLLVSLGVVVMIVGFGLARVYWDEQRDPRFTRGEHISNFLDNLWLPVVVILPLLAVWVLRAKKAKHQDERV